MLKTKTLEYISLKDVCDLFDVNMRDFSFMEYCDNGSFYYLPCSGDWIQDTIDCMEDVSGSHYAEKYRNTLMLQEYVRDEMNLTGIYIHTEW